MDHLQRENDGLKRDLEKMTVRSSFITLQKMKLLFKMNLKVNDKYRCVTLLQRLLKEKDRACTQLENELVSTRKVMSY